MEAAIAVVDIEERQPSLLSLERESAVFWRLRRILFLRTLGERLQRARTYLDGALLCRYDHPATDCQIMGREIDRRLGT